MADETYDNAIRQDERERIAALLAANAEVIEKVAAPGQVLHLAAFLITLKHSSTDGAE